MQPATIKYQSQAVAKLYFIAALGLFTGQIVFGLSIAFAASSFFLSFFSFSGGAVV